MKTKIASILISALLTAAATWGQTFQNLSSDSATLGRNTVSSALPGWNAYVGGTSFSYAVYNTPPLDGSYVGAFDTNSPSYMPKPVANRGCGAMLAAGS